MPAKLLINGRILMALVMFLIFATMVGIALGYPAQARFMPLVVGIPGIALTLIELVRETIHTLRPAAKPGAERDESEAMPEGVARIVARAERAAPAAVMQGKDPSGAQKREWILLSYLTAMIAGLLLFGFWIAVPAFVIVFLKEREKTGWPLTIVLTIGALAVLYFVFYRALGVDLHEGFITEAIKEVLFPIE
jgi:hypothetical protein